MLSVELSHLADILDAAGQGQNISQSARERSTRIHDAVWNTTVSFQSVKLLIQAFNRCFAQVVDNIFAYETNGTL
jgi:uncharacterized protein